MILGIHTSKANKFLDDKSAAKTMSVAIERDVKALDINAVQIFTYGPRFMVPNKLDVDEILSVTKDVDLTVHSAYATTGIWNVSKNNIEVKTSKNKLDVFKAQMLSCKKIGAWGMVLHISKRFADEIAGTMKLLKPIAKKSGVKLILEMVASKAVADKTYETPEKIDNLTHLIGPTENWWGWCVDTAHIWAAGVDIKSYNSMKKWLSSLTYPKKILMFHLNGSSTTMGSGKDTHQIAFGPDDKIWYGIEPSQSGVRAVVEFALKYGITIICEVNRGDERELKKSLAAILKLGEEK
jgi:endonuclease IV